MTTSMIRKAKNLDDKIHANMNKAYAILQAMRALHNEGGRMDDTITGNLLWAASDLIDDALEADSSFYNEQKEKGLWVRYEVVRGDQKIKAVK